MESGDCLWFLVDFVGCLTVAWQSTNLRSHLILITEPTRFRTSINIQAPPRKQLLPASLVRVFKVAADVRKLDCIDLNCG